MTWNAGWLWSQWRGIRLHFKLIWDTSSYFTFLQWYQCPSRIVTVFLGTLWGFIRQVKALYVFDWEHRIVLYAMQGNRASSHSEGEFSWFFLSCSLNLGYILDIWPGWSFKALVCSATSELLSSYEGHLGISTRLGRVIRMLFEVRRDTKDLFQLPQKYWDSYQFSRRVRNRHFLKQWTQRTSRCVKRLWGPLSRRDGGLWLSLESPQGIRSTFILWDEIWACI